MIKLNLHHIHAAGFRSTPGVTFTSLVAAKKLFNIRAIAKNLPFNQQPMKHGPYQTSVKIITELGDRLK